MWGRLTFETFTEFCSKADEILYLFTNLMKQKEYLLKDYKNYVYYEHKFSDYENRDMLVKDKIWEWLMSYKYEPFNKNDLYSLLGQCKKGI